MFLRNLMIGGSRRFGGVLFEGEGSGSGGDDGAAAAAAAVAASAAAAKAKADAASSGAQTFSREYVHELREENKAVRLRAQELEAQKQQSAELLAQAKKDADAAIKAAKDEAAAEKVTSKKAADDRIIKVELKAEATKAGIVDFDDFLKLADLSTVKIDDKGDVVGAVEMLTKLKEAKPYLFGDAKGTSSTTTPPKPGDSTTKKAKDMTPAEREAKLAEFRKKST